MPTPAAVLEAAKLLAVGTQDEPGVGELLLVDVGGATTDVYSVAKGAPSNALVRFTGLPEPYAKRTVEGDLGLFHNLDTLKVIAERGAGPGGVRRGGIGDVPQQQEAPLVGPLEVVEHQDDGLILRRRDQQPRHRREDFKRRPPRATRVARCRSPPPSAFPGARAAARRSAP